MSSFPIVLIQKIVANKWGNSSIVFGTLWPKVHNQLQLLLLLLLLFLIKWAVQRSSLDGWETKKRCYLDVWGILGVSSLNFILFSSSNLLGYSYLLQKWVSAFKLSCSHEKMKLYRNVFKQLNLPLKFVFHEKLKLYTNVFKQLNLPLKFLFFKALEKMATWH